MWYVVMSKSIAADGHPAATEADHRAWLQKHHEAGSCLFSGPTTEGVGIWVLKAGSRDEANAMLQTHPWVQAGIRDVSEMYEWRVRQIMGVGFDGGGGGQQRNAAATQTATP
jgi:uncharacterized protein YciI